MPGLTMITMSTPWSTLTRATIQKPHSRRVRLPICVQGRSSNASSNTTFLACYKVQLVKVICPEPVHGNDAAVSGNSDFCHGITKPRVH